jgi:hypothetical protein
LVCQPAFTLAHAGWIALAVTLVVAPATAIAEERLVDDDTFAVTSTGGLVVDAGLFLATPSALPSGISTGVALGVMRACGCRWSYGVRASWSSITEGSLDYTVTQDDYRLRLVGAIRHDVGRGSLALRLGVGPTFVHEVRTANQGMDAGTTAFNRRAWGTVAGSELDGIVSLHITGAWLGLASAGPAVDRFGGRLAWGWTAMLGVAWQP